MSITELSAYREKRQIEDSPHVSGEAKCLRCGHEYACVSPAGHVAELECPECGCYAGVMKATCAPTDDDLLWICHCGCDVYRVLLDGVMCVSCGVKTGYDEIANADWSE